MSPAATQSDPASMNLDRARSLKRARGKIGLEGQMPARIQVDQQRIIEFCRRWLVTELALFGSVLRDGFRPGSDVDVLVRFDPAARHSLFDLTQMQDELKAIFGREVDLVDRRAVESSENYIRRRDILSAAEAIHVAG